VTTFTAEQPISLAQQYDIPADVAQVVEASRHLCDFRAGFAEVLETLAELAAKRMPDEGQRILTPALRILGAEKAHNLAHDLYVAACHVIGGWDPNVDPGAAHDRLVRLCTDAAHAVSDEFHADSRCCRSIAGGAR
jgi:hypothetical protein